MGDVVVNLINLCFAGLALSFGAPKLNRADKSCQTLSAYLSTSLQQSMGDVVVNLINLCFAGLALGFGAAKSYVPHTRAILMGIWHEALPMLLYSQVRGSIHYHHNSHVLSTKYLSYGVCMPQSSLPECAVLLHAQATCSTASLKACLDSVLAMCAREAAVLTHKVPLLSEFRSMTR